MKIEKGYFDQCFTLTGFMSFNVKALQYAAKYVKLICEIVAHPPVSYLDSSTYIV